MSNQHVVPNGNNWQVKAEKATRATKNFNTQREAINYAKGIAIKQNSEVVIHDRRGRIRDKDSYGNDPCPPKDTKH
nr:DUF2188 domain-containing protein [uncultured Ruminococcus sp.]